MNKSFNVWIDYNSNWSDESNIDTIISRLSSGGFNPTTISEKESSFTEETGLHCFKISSSK